MKDGEAHTIYGIGPDGGAILTEGPDGKWASAYENFKVVADKINALKAEVAALKKDDFDTLRVVESERDALRDNARLLKQLPDGMEKCTIQFVNAQRDMVVLLPITGLIQAVRHARLKSLRRHCT